MGGKIVPGLDKVPETLLLTLAIRAREAQRPDALLIDQRAPAIMASKAIPINAVDPGSGKEGGLSGRKRLLETNDDSELTLYPSGRLNRSAPVMKSRLLPKLTWELPPATAADAVSRSNSTNTTLPTGTVIDPVVRIVL